MGWNKDDFDLIGSTPQIQTFQPIANSTNTFSGLTSIPGIIDGPPVLTQGEDSSIVTIALPMTNEEITIGRGGFTATWGIPSYSNQTNTGNT